MRGHVSLRVSFPPALISPLVLSIPTLSPQMLGKRPENVRGLPSSHWESAQCIFESDAVRPAVTL